jgi:perosamine synthetase
MAWIPHNRLTFDEAEAQGILQVVRSGYWACGPKTRELEKALALRAGASCAIGVSSGSAALRLTLKALGVGRGETVILPAYSCVALANAVLACGAEPIAVDVLRDEWNIDPEAAVSVALARGSRVAIVVNTFGAPADFGPISDRGIIVIEDCSHGFGIAAQGGPMGGRSEAAIISFYATKLIGAGEGGAVLTSLPGVASAVSESRDYTDRGPAPDRFNDKMTDLEAALALCQLARLDETLACRTRLARAYHELLGPTAERTGAFRPSRLGPSRVWYRFVVELLDRSATDVVARLEERGVGAAIPVSDWREHSSDCPFADHAYDSLVSLPLYPTLTEAEQERVIREFLRVIEENHAG